MFTIICQMMEFAESASLATTVGCWLRCSVSAIGVPEGSRQRIHCLSFDFFTTDGNMRPDELTPECPLYIQKQLRRRGTVEKGQI